MKDNMQLFGCMSSHGKSFFGAHVQPWPAVTGNGLPFTAMLADAGALRALT
jgi:hypothetical protein